MYPKIRFALEDVERVLLKKKVLATAEINRLFWQGACNNSRRAYKWLKLECMVK